MGRKKKVCGNCALWVKALTVKDLPIIGFCTSPLPLIIENQSRLDNTTDSDTPADECDCWRSKALPMEIDEDDIVTKSNKLEVLFKSHFRVSMYTTDEGMVVDIYGKGTEDRAALGSTYAYDNEVGN